MTEGRGGGFRREERGKRREERGERKERRERGNEGFQPCVREE